MKDKLVFKGGTALSKVHFPERWRFSEDLDFTIRGNNLADFEALQAILRESLGRIGQESGIEFVIRNFHSNPDYAQIKVQYDAVLQQKNTTNLDVFGGEEIYFEVETVRHSFEDVPEFDMQVYPIAEILVEKLRSLFQRARARDYFDLYQLITARDFNKERIKRALMDKSRGRGVKLDMNEFSSQTEDVKAYWNQALDRLTPSKPEFDRVQVTIRDYLDSLLQ